MLAEEQKNKGVFKIAVLIGLTLIAMLLFLNKDKIRDSFVIGTLKERTLERVDTLNIGDMKHIKIYDGQTVGWNDNWLQFFRKEEGKEDLVGFQLVEERISIGKENVYVISGLNNSVRVLDLYGNEVNEFSFDKLLFNVKEDNNYLMFHLKKDNVDTLKIVDRAGEQVRLHNFTDESLLTYSIMPDGHKYFVSTLDTKNGINSKANMYNLDGKLLWEMEFKDEVVVNSRLIGDTVILFTDMNLYSLRNGEIQWSKSIETLRDILIDDGGIHILYDEHLETINLNGESFDKIELNKNYKQISKYGNYLVLYGERNVVGVREGIKVFEYTHRENIIDMQGNSIYLVIQIDGRADFYVLVNK